MNKTIQAGLVSTIIPVYNRPRMIVEAVESVLAQAYRPIEIIVVNDGSTDDTSQVLVSMARAHSEITVFEQDNAGPGVARELGRQHARGEYIQYLDSDDLLLPTKFSQQVSSLQRQPECGVAYGKTELWNSREPRNRRAWKRTGERIDCMFPSFIRQRWWATSTPLYRRQVTDQVGAWSSTINEEDWEYDCRVAALGTRLAYIDDFVSIHRRHDLHLSYAGSSDSIKLRDRCYARSRIYNSAMNSTVTIPPADMEYFAKSAFLLGRECALAGLHAQVVEMLALSVKANGKANYKHRLFAGLGQIFGWRMVAKFAQFIQRL